MSVTTARAVILIYSTTVMSLVHTEQPKANTDNCTVKAFSTRGDSSWAAHSGHLQHPGELTHLLSTRRTGWSLSRTLLDKKPHHMWPRNNNVFPPSLGKHESRALKAKDSSQCFQEKWGILKLTFLCFGSAWERILLCSFCCFMGIFEFWFVVGVFLKTHPKTVISGNTGLSF